MVRDSRGGMREHVEAGLAKLDTVEVRLSLLYFWSLTESTCSLTLGDVDGECGQPSAIDRGNVSGAQRIAFSAHTTRILPYPAIRQVRAILDVEPCRFGTTNPSSQQPVVSYHLSGYGVTNHRVPAEQKQRYQLRCLSPPRTEPGAGPDRRRG